MFSHLYLYKRKGDVRDWTMSRFARPNRLYDLRTDIEVTCPCGSSPSDKSSSLQ